MQTLTISTVSFPAAQISRFYDFSYAQSEHYWSYLGKINIASRHLLNAAAQNLRTTVWFGPGFPQKVKNLTTHMKLLAIVSVFFSLNDFSSAVQKISKSRRHSDTEGIALETLSATIIAVDAFDSLTTFVNAALAVASLNPIQTFSRLGLSMAFTIVGLGTISRIIQAVKTYNLANSISQDVLSAENCKNKNYIHAFLAEKIGTGNEAEKKQAALVRSAPQESVNEFKNLLKSIDWDSLSPLTAKHLQEITASMDRVLRQLERKMIVNAQGLLANLIIIMGLSLMSVGSGGSVPFLFLATGFMTRIVSLIYQDMTKEKI